MPNSFDALEISATQALTDDAISVTFTVPSQLRQRFSFAHGQYLTLRVLIDGDELHRSYSICSAVGDAVLTIAVKRITGGRVSNYIHEHFRAGVRVDVAQPSGVFTTPLDRARPRRYLCIAAGSGITPILSIAKTVLAFEPQSRVTLLYGNRRTATMMFREELGFVKNAYLERFQWLNVMSREQQDAGVLNGRIDNRKGAELNKRLITIRSFDEFFLCGPEAMISEVSRGLRREGIAEAHIHYELFHASADDARRVIEKHHARAERFGDRVAEVRARVGAPGKSSVP
jgi:ring-1,2-phenylacetyl-CoA epoxidase subunit PaaE